MVCGADQSDMSVVTIRSYYNLLYFNVGWDGMGWGAGEMSPLMDAGGLEVAK